MANYLTDIELCQSFARQNRELIADYICEQMGWSKKKDFHTIHNYIDTEHKILRKGAISAYWGEQVIIPLNMRDGSILAVGCGNPDWNYSAPHGAGRILSRAKAKKTLALADYQNSMKNVYSSTVSTMTIDEAPMAYKPKEWILDVIEATVHVTGVIKPVYNFKADG